MSWHKFLVGMLAPLAAIIADCSPEPEPLRVHLLSGSKEYNSLESLTLWAERLKERYGVESSLTHGSDRATRVEGLAALANADVMVVFCRRWDLEENQAAHIVDWLESGKPVLGIRTASHAFQFYKNLDKDVFGGDYDGHGAGYKDMKVMIAEGGSDHPILDGVSEWTRSGKVYWNRDIALDAEVLLRSQSDDPSQPLAWTRLNGKQRVFYTSMGVPADFRSENFLTMLENALFWVVEK